jgi:predicted RNA binding protein YcfA (HicA-like mRNA interferase family)
MKCSELRRLLSKAGWFVIRSGKGSHVILGHPDQPGVEISFPDHGSSEMSKRLERKFLKQAGLNR